MIINEVKPNISNVVWNATLPETKKEQTGYRISSATKKAFDSYCDENFLQKCKVIEKMIQDFLKSIGKEGLK